MRVGIVTDSAATLPPELASGNEVAIVPMEVTINGRSNGDRRVPLQEVLRHLDDGVRTSSPSPGRFSSAIAAAEDGGGVLVLTVARSMSGTFQVASLAARRAGGPTEVLDTGTAAGGQAADAGALAPLAAAGPVRAARRRPARPGAGRGGAAPGGGQGGGVPGDGVHRRVRRRDGGPHRSGPDRPGLVVGAGGVRGTPKGCPGGSGGVRGTPRGCPGGSGPGGSGGLADARTGGPDGHPAARRAADPERVQPVVPSWPAGGLHRPADDRGGPALGGGAHLGAGDRAGRHRPGAVRHLPRPALADGLPPLLAGLRDRGPGAARLPRALT